MSLKPTPNWDALGGRGRNREGGGRGAIAGIAVITDIARNRKSKNP
jgi:hypothetical protein